MSKRYSTGLRGLAIAALSSVALFATGAAAEQHLRLATGQSSESLLQKEAYGVWAEALNTESNGALRVESFPPPFATASNMWDRVTAGVADMGIASLNNTGLPLKAAFVASLPGLGRNTEAASVAMWKLYEKGLLDVALDEVEVLGFQTAIAFTLNSKTPITKLEDLKGLRVRVADANSANAIAALGGAPVSIAFNEAYQAIDRGVVDAAVGNVNTGVIYRFAELLPHEQPAMAFGMTTFVFAMNKDAYANLDDAGKAAIDAWRGERLSRFMGAKQNDFRTSFEARLTEAGQLIRAEMDEAELARWSVAIDPVVAQWIKDTPKGQEVYDTFLAEYNTIDGAN
ncbi:TRAP transporter substrate-binding protein DctP [Falsigemmobacter faecalis]|uniref:TRAP transporter substrate-binding protein n=1 Tax=Falsigemmobacter faecalis TaxID=2488730 RepID=A0A3P3D4K5_9RHOB|nr:TRAP transporter substrate-binding protein DctP [Falsigemmobacter faecalis]RRH69343.1 hypothetical protein EG244_18530 [Falsigemmobacter faecalis]